MKISLLVYEENNPKGLKASVSFHKKSVVTRLPCLGIEPGSVRNIIGRVISLSAREDLERWLERQSGMFAFNSAI